MKNVDLLNVLAGVGAHRRRAGVFEPRGFPGGAEWVTYSQGWDGLHSLAFPLSREGFLLGICLHAWGELGLLCTHSRVVFHVFPKAGVFLEALDPPCELSSFTQQILQVWERLQEAQPALGCSCCCRVQPVCAFPTGSQGCPDAPGTVCFIPEGSASSQREFC